MTTVHTVQVVEVEDDPVGFYLRPNPDYADLPEPFASALQDIIDNPDDRACATCNKGVGYVLVDTDDLGGATLVWKWTTLLTGPAGIVVPVCEECGPPLYLTHPVNQKF